VGYDHANHVNVSSAFPFSIDVDHSDSAIVVGSVGYKFDWGLRVENEVGYDSHGIKSLVLDGSTDVKSDLVNFVYDFPLSDLWSLSLGAGVGAANVGEHLHETALPGFSFAHGSNVVFQWQAIGGIDYTLSDDLELFADYRFRSVNGAHDYPSDFVAFDPIRVSAVNEQAFVIGVRWFPWPVPPSPPPPP
jgi:opacity protein-like surface antigen